MNTKFSIVSFIAKKMGVGITTMILSALITLIFAAILLMGFGNPFHPLLTMTIFFVSWGIIWAVSFGVHWFFDVADIDAAYIRTMKELDAGKIKIEKISYNGITCRITGRFTIVFNEGAQRDTWTIDSESSPMEFFIEKLDFKEVIKHYCLIKRVHNLIVDFHMMDELK